MGYGVGYEIVRHREINNSALFSISRRIALNAALLGHGRSPSSLLSLFSLTHYRIVILCDSLVYILSIFLIQEFYVG